MTFWSWPLPYINASLPFRATSSCKIFEKVATLVEWVIKHHTRRHHVSHYLDDSSLLGRSFNNTLTFIWEFTQILQELSLPLVEKKTIGPCVVLKYLGMLLDFFHQMGGIPKEKRKRLFGAGGRIDFIEAMAQLQWRRFRKLLVIWTSPAMPFWLVIHSWVHYTHCWWYHSHQDKWSSQDTTEEYRKKYMMIW